MCSLQSMRCLHARNCHILTHTHTLSLSLTHTHSYMCTACLLYFMASVCCKQTRDWKIKTPLTVHLYKENKIALEKKKRKQNFFFFETNAGNIIIAEQKSRMGHYQGCTSPSQLSICLCVCASVCVYVCVCMCVSELERSEYCSNLWK